VGFGLVGTPAGASDPLSFELHTTSLKQATVAGGATLATDSLQTEEFKLTALSEKPCVLRGVDVADLVIEMAGGEGDVTVQGKAGYVYIMNSSSGDFDGSQLITQGARVVPSDIGKTTLRLDGEGLKEYTATP